MKKLFLTQTKLNGLPANHVVETYIADDRPAAALCAAAYCIVVKSGKFLQRNLAKGKLQKPNLDIPGGDLTFGIRIEDSLTEQVLDQTGILIDKPALVAFKETTINAPKPAGWNYPYPTSYVLFYLAESRGGELKNSAVWSSKKSKKIGWYSANVLFVNEILKYHKHTPLVEKTARSIRLRERACYLLAAAAFLIVIVFGTYAYFKFGEQLKENHSETNRVGIL